MESRIIEQCQPYRLRMSCGHVEIRLMREATAGVPFGPAVMLDVQSSACCECEPSKATMRESQRAINAKYGAVA